MIDVSGYGLLKDDYTQIVSGKEYISINEGNYMDDTSLNDLISTNIKSKFIEATPEEDPIIESKSLSVYTPYLSTIKENVNNSTYNYMRNSCDRVVDNKVLEEFANTKYDRLLKLYNAYNYKECDMYPIMNYDLVDIRNEDPNATDYNDSIFYDKLLIGGSKRTDILKQYGRLYDISPDNIPVLTKIIYSTVEDHTVTYKLDSTKLNKLFEIVNVYEHDPSNSLENKISVLVKVKPHYRTINTTYMNSQKVYIPTLLLVLNFYCNIVENKRYLNLSIDNSNNTKCNDVVYLSTKLFMITDPDYIFYSTFKLYDSFKNFDNLNRSEKDLLITRYNITPLFTERMKYKSLYSVKIWPFGNVHGDGRPCMHQSRLSSILLTNLAIIRNNFSIDVSSVVDGFYKDFMESRFNRDLISEEFILKDSYDSYLDYRDSFIDKKDGFKDFIHSLQRMREEIEDRIKVSK